MKNAQRIDLGLTGYDELFMNEGERRDNALPKIHTVPISEIDDFPDHPFKVRMDEDMDQLAESVRTRGVITPVTLRQKETEAPKTTEVPKEPAPPAPPVEIEQEPEPEPEPTFDINYWISYAQSVAVSKGLTLESSAADCWDNPITANPDCICLERDINSRMSRYAKDVDITDVWIWYECVGQNSYLIYVGYA